VETGKAKHGGVWYIWCQIELGGQFFCRTVEAKDFAGIGYWLDELYLPEYVNADAFLQLSKLSREIATESGKPKSLFNHYIDWCIGYHDDEDKN
jgi:hypothetical protein